MANAIRLAAANCAVRLRRASAVGVVMRVGGFVAPGVSVASGHVNDAAGSQTAGDQGENQGPAQGSRATAEASTEMCKVGHERSLSTHCAALAHWA